LAVTAGADLAMDLREIAKRGSIRPVRRTHDGVRTDIPAALV
jgi:hypothetical protein